MQAPLPASATLRERLILGRRERLALPERDERLLLFSVRVLVLAFGGTYRAAYPALAILALGQLINAAFSSVSLLLNMTGHERDTLKGVVVACVANVTLNIVLIPPLGMEGAAVATAITFLIWNAQLWRQVEKTIGINSLAFSMRRS